MTDEALLEIVRRACEGQMADEEVAELALALAESGEMIGWECRTADLASTGSPSSLSTLLVPLFIRCAGFLVPKLAVPGRPAGGVDVMAQIPGYRTDLSADEVLRVMDECGYVHFEAGQRLAPLDARLFKLRQAVGAQAVTPLVIASLLAKKVAVGVQNVGLDVRVASYGNFGGTPVEAKSNAAWFCRVASLLGLRPTCILTDATKPYQPYIGRREALVALWGVLNDRTSGSLEQHLEECASMARAILGVSDVAPASDVRAAFLSNVGAQGGVCDFNELERRVVSEHHRYVTAHGSGHVRVDLARIRTTLVNRQKTVADAHHPYPDPVGIILLRTNGDFVEHGDAVMSVRTPDKWWPELSNELAQAVSFSPEPMPVLELGEVING